MSGAADAIQYAIFDRLTEALDIPVYSFVPDNTQGEFVQIGDDTLIDLSGDCFVGFEATLTIHAWTIPAATGEAYRGAMRCKEIQTQIYNALNRQDFTISGYNNLGCNAEFSETFQDSDGVSWHGVQRFRILLDTLEIS